MNYMNISDLCQCRAQVQKSVNVPLLQKSVRKIQRKCTENATHRITVCYKGNFKSHGFETYLHIFLGLNHHLN
jgi:aspartate ammonia-lyase